jgi:hypothetical protein
MKKRWLKFTRRVDFYFVFEYRNLVLSRETLICRFWLRISAQENLYEYLYLWAIKITSKKIIFWECLCQNRNLWVSVRNVRKQCPEYPDIYPEYPGTLLPAASFRELGYKYPPSASFLLPTFRAEQHHKPKSFLTHCLPFLRDFLKGFKWEGYEKKSVLLSCHSILLST